MTPRTMLSLAFCLTLSACSAGGPHRTAEADGAGPEGSNSADAASGGGDDSATAGSGGGGDNGGSGGAGGIGGAGGTDEPDGASTEADASETEADASPADAAGNASADGGSSGQVDWSNCGDPKTESKTGVSSTDFCAEFAVVCGFGKGTGYYADMKACLAAYEGRDAHHYDDGKRVCVAYTICAIAGKTLKPALCGVPNIYRCGHRDETAP